MMNMMNIPPSQYLPSSPSGTTVQVMNTVANANMAASQYGSLSNVIGQAMTADLSSKLAQTSSLSKLSIRLSDIKSDAQVLAKMTPEMAVAAGLNITDDYGNTVIGKAPQQQGYQQMMMPQQPGMMMPQQQGFAPQQPQQMNQQQQFAMMMMQELKQMQAQMNQSAPADRNNSFSQASSATSAWDLASSDPFNQTNASIDSGDDGMIDFWGNSSTSSSSNTLPSNDFLATEKPSTPTKSNTSSQAQMQQFMDKMMQMMMMMMQGGMMAPQNTMQMSQQQYPQMGQYPQQQMMMPQPKMTLLDFKAMQASTNMVVNAPQQSAMTQRVMENAQGGSDDSFSF